MLKQLNSIFWFKQPENVNFHDSGHQGDLPFIDNPLDMDVNFCLDNSKIDYYPPSSYRTPIFWLLKFSLKKTIDFILYFTNKTVECYAKSDLGKEEVIEIDVFIENEKISKQYIDEIIWNIYRGTKNYPAILQSIHMALEKFFLEISENSDSKTLEWWLLYLLRNTKSASITAVVTSIVLAFPDKTFNIARILFKTKEFFMFDTQRLSLEHGAESLFSIGYFGLNSIRDFHQNERIKTCDKEFRKKSLESLALSYQIFKNDQIDNKKSQERQQAIWEILDGYYDNLPENDKENELDKTWRLYLAGMDSRKMTPKIEEKDDQLFIKFENELDPELKKFSETSNNEILEKMKFMNLKMWASHKMRNNEQYKKFNEFNDNYKFVLKGLKEVINGFKLNDIEFNRLYYTIPGDVSSVLVRDYYEHLSEDEKIYCKSIIYEVASSSLRENYGYQLWDGVDSAISVLPILLKEFGKDKELIKCILFLTLFDPHPFGINSEFCDYSKNAILNLWDKNFDDAQSLLLGYLWLKPKYEELRLKLYKKNYENNIYVINEFQIIEEFVKTNETNLQIVFDNKIAMNDLNNIELLDLDVLKTAFQIIPIKTKNIEHKDLVQTIISTFAEALLKSDNGDDKVDYRIMNNFLEKLTDFVLNSNESDISNYLKPFIDNFNSSETMGYLFEKFIYAEDRLNTYDNFWNIWNLFYEKIFELAKNGENWYTRKTIQSYLFANNYWPKQATYWHTFKETDKRFFKKVTENIGQSPSVLYSISKLLNNIGSIYLDDGVLWISSMLNLNKNLWISELEDDTVYYLEKIVRTYAYKNGENLKTNSQLRLDFLVILNFLIEKGSVSGYMIRESIL